MSAYGNARGARVGYSSGGRITWAVQRLILFTAAIFAVQLIARPLEAVLMARGWPDSSELLGFQPTQFFKGYLWQPFTYMFLHGGLWHLTMNLVTLYFFGPDVEREIGTPKFYRLFVFCGAVGVLATLFPFLLAGKSANVVGASGAVMGVLVAFVVLDPQRQVFMLPLPMPITALGLLMIFLVLNLVTALQDSGTSVATHFGGMAAGYAFMKFVPMYTRWQRRRRFHVVPKDPPAKTGAAAQGWDDVGKVVNDILKSKERDFSGRDQDQ